MREWRESNFGMGGVGAWGASICKILVWVKKQWRGWRGSKFWREWRESIKLAWIQILA